MKEQWTLIETGIYRNPEGLYKVDVSAKCWKTGKLKRMRTPAKSLHRSLEEARAWRQEMRALVQGEQAQTPPRTTLGSYALEWIERKEKRLAPAAGRAYRNALAVGILPYLGDIYCDALRRSDLEDWVALIEGLTYERAGSQVRYAQDSLRQWHRTLSTLVADMAADLGVDNPMRRISAPRSNRKLTRERRTLTSAQLTSFVEAARQTERYAEIVTLAYTGMRSGELWALRWEDVDGEKLHIKRTVSDGVIRDTTKTGWEREVYAPPIVQEAISAHRMMLMRTQDRRLHSELVFPSIQLTPRSTGSLRKALEVARIAARIKQDISPLVLRRSFNTLLLELGTDAIVLRSQMGHSDSTMTARYAGVHLTSKKAAVEGLFNA